MVTIDMSVTFPHSEPFTKSKERADLPKIDNIYVAVFGSKHYLNDYAKAIPCDAEGNVLTSFATTNADDTYHFKVNLVASTSQRFVHIIANGPDQLDYNTQDKDLMLNLYTSGTNSGYWQSFELDGTAKLSGTKWVPSDDAVEKFSEVQLIRNFARVKVVQDIDALPESKFKLAGFRVYNTALYGSYAMPLGDNPSSLSAYDLEYMSVADYVNTKDQSIEETDVDKVSYIKDTLNYKGYMPTDDLADNAAPSIGDSFISSGYQYVYESPNTSANFPYIIIKGYYNGESTATYYKLEFCDEMGVREPIYRNLDYTITLSGVGKRGVTDPALAVTSNKNVSTTAVKLSEISDGISGLYVLTTDRTVVNVDKNTQGNPIERWVEFRYQYIPNLDRPTENVNSNVTLEDPMEDSEGVGQSIVIPTSGSWYEDRGTEDGWKVIRFKVKNCADADAANGMLVSSFQVIGTSNTGAHLYRTIKIRVIESPEYKNTGISGGATVNSNVDVTFTLPSGLPGSIFPLTFTVYDSGKCLNPRDDKMPVVIDDENHSYYFTRTVSLSEYQNNTKITLAMKRIQAGSTTVTVNNEYFGSFSESL